jgi:hypothetical protein
MTATEHFPTAQDALSYRRDHDARVRELNRKTMPSLRGIYGALLAGQGHFLVYGGPGSKDELVSAIIGIEYPRALINESAHAAYHGAGGGWDACEWCK